jgi:hypothetical protein
MRFAVVMKDLLKSDALELAHTHNCEVVIDTVGNYVAIGEDLEEVACVELKANHFFDDIKAIDLNR